MAYQPKSYRKFVATAATATLVAGVLAPAVSAASFTDVPERYQEAVDFVVSKGIQGFSDTQFGTGENIKRVDAAVMVAKVVGLDTESAPAAGFTDVPARAQGAVNALKAAGITSGKSTTSFGAQDLITRGELAIWIDRAFNLEGSADHNFTDVADRYAEAVEALVANEITNGVSATSFGVTQNAKRGDFAIFLHRASNVDAELEVVEVSAVNAKTIEVDFNTAVEDTSKASVELLRGAFKQNATVTWSEDKKSVQLAGASNFQAAEYTVNISGLTEEKLTGSVKIEAQKVASIEILDEVAVVSAADANGSLAENATATVGYQVKDQYGTDISENITLTTNAGSVSASKGVVTLDDLEGKKVGDIVPVVLIDTATGTSASKAVKLSAASTVSSIEVAGIYNAKGEEVALNDASKASEAFIVLNLEDQYGKEITDVAKAKGLVITNTNPTNLTIASGVEAVKIGDKDKLVIKISEIKKAGSTDVLLISTTNGQSAKYTVNVAETATSDAISVSQPEIAVAEEETLIPVTVSDKAGNVITDKKLLSNTTKGIKVDGSPVKEDQLVVKDGQVFFKKEFATAGTQALVFQSSTYKVATVTVNVKEVAKETLVRGLKNPLVISTAKAPVTINAKDHLVIEDQYGREMKGSTATVAVSVVGETEVLSLSGNTVTPVKNGTATLKVALVVDNKVVDSSAVEVKVQVTDGTQYSDYEVAEIGLTKADSEKSIKVNGLLNGGKVALAPSEYTATVTGGEGQVLVEDGKFTVEEQDLNLDSKGNEIDTEFTLKVTVNATGKVYEQKFVVSNKKEVVQDFFFTTSEAGASYADAKAITEATLEGGATIAEELTSAKVNVATVDQYGNKQVVAISDSTITVVPEKAGEVTITGNGTPSAKVALRGDVKESVVTLNIKVGSATKELKVKVVAPQ
ncbi:S-layer homology domain-containing protein [Cytobacillus gottheilii]|uniref:S-layer homology domain-containing protein n=1 Tax=Cytobacillus gottheilii TaxID=859144 RepID=UPI003CF2937D